MARASSAAGCIAPSEVHRERAGWKWDGVERVRGVVPMGHVWVMYGSCMGHGYVWVQLLLPAPRQPMELGILVKDEGVLLEPLIERSGDRSGHL
jgi:hypothetical protein